MGWVSDNPGSHAILWQEGVVLTELSGLTKTASAKARGINSPVAGRLVQVPGSSDGSSVPTKAAAWDLHQELP